MKPQVSYKHQTAFPVTDYNYQPMVDAAYARTKEKQGAHRLHGFWRLGSAFHSAEALRHDAIDFLIFTLMGISCAWPIVSVGKAIAHVFLG